VWFLAISEKDYKNHAGITKVPSQTPPQPFVNALKCKAFQPSLKDVFMRWTSWLLRSHPRRLSVVGVDIGPDVCSLVVLSGTPTQPDSVCCAERLNLPDRLVAHGEVLQSADFGQWLRTYLDAGDLVNLASEHALPVDLYWHCWNLDSQVIDRLTAALVGAAEQALAKNTMES